MYPLKNYTFEGLQLAGPADPTAYLDRAYGSWVWGLLPHWLPTGSAGPLIVCAICGPTSVLTVLVVVV